jgi:hypothetical protein
MQIARIYERVSTDEQGLTRQDALEASTRAAGFYMQPDGRWKNLSRDVNSTLELTQAGC